MPIIKADSALVYFAHVPKCGGTAVSNHLAARFGALAFRDQKFLAKDGLARWTRSSPQHVDVASLQRLFPEGFFDLIFAVVRHPVERAISVYHFQSDIQETISPDIMFSQWLAEVPEQLRDHPFHHDNHHRPMVDFVPPAAQVFRLEDGMAKVDDWLTQQFGRKDGLADIGTANVRSERKQSIRSQRPRTVATAADIAIIEETYAADYARFGYALQAAIGDQGADD